MQSLSLLVAVGALMAVPGTAAALLGFKPGRVGIVTRLAAVFGLGFAIAGGCAFALAAADLFWLYTYLPLWCVCTAGLWWLAVRRVQFGAQLDALRTELRSNRVPLLLGGAVMVVMLLIRAFYLHELPGPHYVYYLNGIEIANDHGIPSHVLEYGRAWPPATDKIFLDSFTAVLTLIHNNPLVGPGVLLWSAFAGAAIGLWASAWELGLRWTAILLPVLILADRKIPGFAGTGLTVGFDVYRAENFGMAVAFCAVAVGISAVRRGGRVPALLAGVVLAAASASHLVPTVIAVVLLGSVIFGELIRRGRSRSRAFTLQDSGLLAVTAAVLGLLIRLFAGGTFGLGGASNQASYKSLQRKVGFDPTQYLYNGKQQLPSHQTSHFFLPASSVIQTVVRLATGLRPSFAVALVVLAAAVLVVVVFMVIRTDFVPLAFAGAGVLLGVTLIALFFSFHYHVWVDATFGIRRPTIYGPLGTFLLALGLLEAGMLWVHGREWTVGAAPLATVLGTVAVLALCIWILPSSRMLQGTKTLDRGQLKFVAWTRAHTACGARLLLNERSEGLVAATTGRFALDEGMGAYLLPKRLTHVVDLLQQVSQFYVHPWAHERFLRENHINYVVRSNEIYLLGYSGPVRVGLDSKLNRTKFLTLVDKTEWFSIYHVNGSVVAPVSPLLKGSYLGCRTNPATI